MFPAICRLLLLPAFLLSVAGAVFEATAATPAFRLLPQLRLRNQNRAKLMHCYSYDAYKPYRHH